MHRQLQRVPDGPRRAVVDPGGQPRGARGASEDRGRAELHHGHRAAGDRPAASRGGPPLADDLVLPVRVRRRLEGDARAGRAGRQAPGPGGGARSSRRRVAARGRSVRQDDRVQRRSEDRRVRSRRLHGRGSEDHGRAPEDPRHPGPARRGHGRPRTGSGGSRGGAGGRVRPADHARRGARRCCARHPASSSGTTPRTTSIRARSSPPVWMSRWSAGSARCPAATTRSRSSAAPTTSAQGAALDAVHIAEHLFLG